MIRGVLISLLTLCFISLTAQVPQRPLPQRLVNDFASIFSPSDTDRLERALVAFNDSTSNQITIVTVLSLNGLDKAQYAYQIGESWGVGSSKYNNGVVILIKPKTKESKGDIFIATGYGVEGVLPDATCRRIIESEMIPLFKRDDYFGGVVAALNVMMPILAGEYSYTQYNSDEDDAVALITAILVILFVIVVTALIVKSKRGGGGGNYGGWIGGIGGAGMGRFGGGGHSRGGFGGFGGGRFGGGGAGGSW